MEELGLRVALEKETRIGMVLEGYLRILLVHGPPVVVPGLVQLPAAEERFLRFFGPASRS